MKKIITFSFVFSFLIGGFLIIKPVSAFGINDGCLPGQNYSTTTGQRCFDTETVVPCAYGELDSSVKGKICLSQEQHTGYLSLEGHSFTMWGTHRITNDNFAVCVRAPCPSASPSYLVSAGNSSSVLSDLHRYENSKVKIIGQLNWYNLEGGFWGIVATKVIPINTNEENIKVLSPNDGETLVLGQKYNIQWDSANLNGPKVNIYLKDDSINCSSGIVGCWSSFAIEGQIQNNRSYLWDTSKNLFGSAGPNSYTIRPGINYRIIVCSSMTDICDESDNYFKFVEQQTNMPVISGISGPQSLNVNQTGTWKVTATDSSGGNLSYSVNWGDDDYRLSRSSYFSPLQIGQTATFTHSYGTTGIYNPIFTVTNQNGVNTETSLSVNVGNSIYPPGCISNIGYSTITGASCSSRECMAPGSVCDLYSPTPYLFERTLQIGNRGIDVQNLQTFLSLNADGSFGPITRERVMEWQRGVGLTADGIFGPASRQMANSSGI